MRNTLRQLLKNAICVELMLPDSTKKIDKTVISSIADVCFRTLDSHKLAQSIYNGIIECSINEFEIDYGNLENEQLKVLARRLKYDPDADDVTKSRYGFYGEVLLDIILRCFLKTNVLLARGYLYQPIAKSEIKGFDAFHILERDGNIELWLGEAKFYKSYKKPVSDVLKKIKYSLSDKYVNDNVLTLIDWQDRFSSTCSKLSKIMDKWENNPLINIASEIANENMTITYPIMIAYQKKKSHIYIESVKECIKYINQEIRELSFHITNSFRYKIFFIFLPVDDVSIVKEKVFRWIDSKEPLI